MYPAFSVKRSEIATKSRNRIFALLSLKGATSRYFEWFLATRKITINLKEITNISLVR